METQSSKNVVYDIIPYAGAVSAGFQVEQTVFITN